MKAIAVDQFGGPEALRVFELPTPRPGARELLIRVHAAAVNPTDLLLRAGVVAHALKDQTPPYIPGMDAAGVVEAVGADSDGRFSVGDHVIALVLPTGPHKGAYAEQIVVSEASVVPAPTNADFPEAATLLMNAATVRLALDRLALKPGQTLGITGAAGAVGAYAIQLAKADGLRVIADAQESDRELVERLGADLIAPRGDAVGAHMRAAVPEGVAGVLDAALQHERVLPAIADGGTLVTLRGWQEPAPRGIRVTPVFVREAAKETALLQRLRDQAEQGVLTLRVAAVYPASQAAHAHRKLEAGGVRGRLVLDFRHVAG